jgi:hypothetical protein
LPAHRAAWSVALAGLNPDAVSRIIGCDRTETGDRR